MNAYLWTCEACGQALPTWLGLWRFRHQAWVKRGYVTTAGVASSGHVCDICVAKAMSKLTDVSGAVVWRLSRCGRRGEEALLGFVVGSPSTLAFVRDDVLAVQPHLSCNVTVPPGLLSRPAGGR